MSEHPFTDGEEEEDSEEGDDELENERTRIEASVGSLSVKIENHDPEACEKQFKHIWKFILSDVDEWSKAMSDVLTKNGGFQ